MNSMFSRLRFLSATLAVAALTGCNAVEDVRSDPFVQLPAPTVVLQGSVTGLGSKRSMVLTNNGDLAGALTVIAPVPVSTSSDIGNLAVPFSFGAKAVRDANGNPVSYDVDIRVTPYGKTCAFDGGSDHGVLSPDSPPYVRIVCTPIPGMALYDITVDLDPAFANADGAKVQLRTEEGLFEQAVTAANKASLTMKFEDKLVNASSLLANGPLAVPAAPAGSPVFEYTVSATTTEGGTLNKCPITNASNRVISGNLQNPSADIVGSAMLAPKVERCSFTISGTIHYSRPAGVTADPARGAGLVLDIKDLSGVRKGTVSVPAGAFPANFTFNNLDTPATTAFTSNPSSDFQVVVATQPANQTCIVADAGYVSLKSLVQLNPVNVTGTGVTATNATPTAGVASATNIPVPGTRLVVFCRDKPAPGNALHGVYRLTRTVAQIANSTGTVNTVNSPWVPYDFSVQNTASSNILSFWDDGTFLYGTHHNTTQVEHGFYDYSPSLPANTGAPNGRLRFTLHTDTFYSTLFPTTFSSAEQGSINGNTTTPGISALPGALTFTASPNAPAPFRHANLGNVVKTVAVGSSPARITGTAGPYGGVAASNSSATFSNPGPITANSAARQVDWELTEVQQLSGQFTGGWTTQDHRRLWVWDKDNNYGNSVGVNGLPHVESSCFAVEVPTSPAGTYQRRGTSTGCYAVNRPRSVPLPGQTLGQIYFSGFNEAADNAYLLVTHQSSNAAPGPTSNWPTVVSPTVSGNYTTGNVVPGQYQTAQLRDRFPQYEARIPGGNSAADGRSPSPIHYFVAPAASFTGAAPADIFPAPAAPFSSWCGSDILGIRSTLNGIPYQEPVYMCRTIAR